MSWFKKPKPVYEIYTDKEYLPEGYTLTITPLEHGILGRLPSNTNYFDWEDDFDELGTEYRAELRHNDEVWTWTEAFNGRVSDEKIDRHFFRFALKTAKENDEKESYIANFKYPLGEPRTVEYIEVIRTRVKE